MVPSWLHYVLYLLGYLIISGIIKYTSQKPHASILDLLKSIYRHIIYYLHKNIYQLSMFVYVVVLGIARMKKIPGHPLFIPTLYKHI